MSPNSSTHTKITKPATRKARAWGWLSVLLLVSMACTTPGLEPTQLVEATQPPAVEQEVETAPTPTQPAGPLGTAQELPPALVETDPPIGSQLPLDGTITLYFNQPMDTASVEGATDGHANHPGDIIPAPAEGCPLSMASTSSTPTSWNIAGQTFLSGASLVVFGDPQPGDWVSFEGRELAMMR